MITRRRPLPQGETKKLYSFGVFCGLLLMLMLFGLAACGDGGGGGGGPSVDGDGIDGDIDGIGGVMVKPIADGTDLIDEEEASYIKAIEQLRDAFKAAAGTNFATWMSYPKEINTLKGRINGASIEEGDITIDITVTCLDITSGIRFDETITYSNDSLTSPFETLIREGHLLACAGTRYGSYGYSIIELIGTLETIIASDDDTAIIHIRPETREAWLSYILISAYDAGAVIDEGTVIELKAQLDPDFSLWSKYQFYPDAAGTIQNLIGGNATIQWVDRATHTVTVSFADGEICQDPISINGGYITRPGKLITGSGEITAFPVLESGEAYIQSGAGCVATFPVSGDDWSGRELVCELPTTKRELSIMADCLEGTGTLPTDPAEPRNLFEGEALETTHIYFLADDDMKFYAMRHEVAGECALLISPVPGPRYHSGEDGNPAYGSENCEGFILKASRGEIGADAEMILLGQDVTMAVGIAIYPFDGSDTYIDAGLFAPPEPGGTVHLGLSCDGITQLP